MHFTAVIANPPFFEAGRAAPRPAEARAAARHMAAGSLDLWVKTAATHAAPGGEMIFIHAPKACRPCSRPSRPLRRHHRPAAAPREGEPAQRVLIRGIKGSRAPLTLLAAPRPARSSPAATSGPSSMRSSAAQARLHW